MDDLDEQSDSRPYYEKLDDVRDTFGVRCWKVALFVRADLSEEPILVLLLLGINLKREGSPRSSSNYRHVEHADVLEFTVSIMLDRRLSLSKLASVDFC